MKTSEIKNFAIPLSKLNKYKQNDNKQQDQQMNFTPKDLRNIELVYQGLKKVNNINPSLIETNFKLLQKIKRIISDSEQKQQKKTKFRVNKSTKKVIKQDAINDDETQQFNSKPIKLSPISDLNQNKSEMYSGRVTNKDLYLRDSNLHSKRTYRLPQLQQRKQIIGKQNMRFQCQQLSIQRFSNTNIYNVAPNFQQKKNEELQTLKQKIQSLKEQNKKLRQMLHQISILPQPKPTQEKIQKQELQNVQIQKISTNKEQEIKQNQNQNEKVNKKQKIKQNEKVRVQGKQQYLTQVITHLQLLVVSQTKEIDSLVGKMIQNQNQKQNAKSSRWNSY